MEFKTRFIEFVNRPADPITLLLYAAVFLLGVIWMFRGIA